MALVSAKLKMYGSADQVYRIALQDGDCGSWVVDSICARVCGHVIATDDFGEAILSQSATHSVTE
jgi:hypothetical protein